MKVPERAVGDTAIDVKRVDAAGANAAHDPYVRGVRGLAGCENDPREGHKT